VRKIKVGWQGRFLEDFEVGDVYRSRIGRTITEADNIQFTLLTCNSNQLHFNRVYGAATEWGQPLVNSALTLAVVAGLSVVDVSENGFALGWDAITLPSPVFAGDTLYAETEVLEVRESRSRPTSGIIKVDTRGVKQDGSTVIRYVRSVMVWRRAHAPVRSGFPELRETDGADSRD
jgi:itaconyl-CoA hydratase